MRPRRVETGFVVSGTVSADDDETEVERAKIELTVSSIETKKCFDAVVAQTEAVLTLDVLAGDALDQVSRMRDQAGRDAAKQRKVLGADALFAQLNASSEQIRAALAAARTDVLAAADLATCQDGKPDTTVDVDVALLRARYDEIVRDLGRKLAASLTDARKAFDALVRNAPIKPSEKGSDGSHSSD